MLKALAPPDTHHLSAAIGWLELGNAAEAALELNAISPACQTHPDVLQTSWHVSAKQADWEACLKLAATLIELYPKSAFGWIHRSYALHELKRTAQALDELLPAAAKFSRDWLIRYNLACYCSRLGRLAEAREWLEKAFKLGNREQLKQMATEDPDLEMVWSGF